MKTMKAICKATVLALVLSVSAFGGDIAAPGAPCPDPTKATPPNAPADGAAIGNTALSIFAESLQAMISLI